MKIEVKLYVFKFQKRGLYYIPQNTIKNAMKYSGEPLLLKCNNPKLKFVSKLSSKSYREGKYSHVIYIPKEFYSKISQKDTPKTCTITIQFL